MCVYSEAGTLLELKEPEGARPGQYPGTELCLWVNFEAGRLLELEKEHLQSPLNPARGIRMRTEQLLFHIRSLFIFG